LRPDRERSPDPDTVLCIEEFEGSLKDLCQEFTSKTANVVGREGMVELKYPRGQHSPRGETRSLNVLDDDYGLKVGTALAKLLGLVEEHADTYLHGEEYPSSTIGDIKPHLRHLYVYCDLDKPQIVNNSHEPLLRIVPLQTKDRDKYPVIHKIIDTYMQPLHHTTVSKIRIHIRGDDDRPMEFHQEGIVIAMLIFQRRPHVNPVI
jgi:hypothetical protein